MEKSYTVWLYFLYIYQQEFAYQTVSPALSTPAPDIHKGAGISVPISRGEKRYKLHFE